VEIRDLPEIFEMEYQSEIWEELGEKCLSCGSCSMVCPTCYCYDVADQVELGSRAGRRVRSWDSCLFANHALVASGENFRGPRASRIKFRFYHKQRGFVAEYGRPSCVGCGRCITACPVNIDVVQVIDRLRWYKMLLADEAAAHHPVLGANPYQPHMARIVRIYKMVDNNYLFTLRFVEDQLAHSFRHQPGQFIMLSVPGVGEMPISASSSPSRPEVLELCVRRAGRVTGALYRMRANDVVGVRGPYGNGYPMQEIMGSDLLLAAGGLGMAPLRSLLWYALDHRDRFNNITLMYGAKRPEDMLFREELLASWTVPTLTAC